MGSQISDEDGPTAPGSADSQQACVRHLLTSDRSAPGIARRVVSEAASRLPGSLIDRVELAVSELVTNAVRHGTEPGADIELVVERTTDEIAVRVADPGSGSTQRRAGDGGGFGLGIVERVADEVTIDTRDGWTVRAVFTLEPDQPQPDGF